jgi:glycosyltransferase involved in cell wall biosynthesis
MSNAMVGFALAPEISSEFVHWGLAEDRIVLLGNVVDVHAFRPPVPDHRREKFVLGFVGRVGERKGSLVVLGGLAELRARDYPEARALFVGPFQSDEFRLRFWSRARELDVQDSVEVTGYLEDVGDLVCGEMSVFALPSRAEGLPGALCEAMAAGVPVVVTGLSSMLRIVEESGAGLVVGHDDPSSLADAVAALWADPAVWSRTSRQARSYAESKFAIDVNVSRYVEYALKGSQRTHDK